MIEVWVAIGMAADIVPFLFHALHDFRILLGSSPHHKKCGLHRVITENVQYPRGIDGIRSVIDC